MSIGAYIVVAFLGAMVGSFINVVVMRLHTGRSIFTGRSACDSCGEELSWTHLVPVISFIALLGRCGMCGSKIGINHIFAEVILGGLFLHAFILYGLSPVFFLTVAFLALLVGIVIYDLRHTIIPNTFVYPLIVLSFGITFLSEFQIESVIAALSMSALFALIWLLSKGRAMGFGDAKLVLALALFVGYPLSLTGFILSFWIGAVISVFLLVISGKRRTMGHEVPFAPYLAIGFLCAHLLQLNLFPVLLF